MWQHSFFIPAFTMSEDFFSSLIYDNSVKMSAVSREYVPDGAIEYPEGY